MELRRLDKIGGLKGLTEIPLIGLCGEARQVAHVVEGRYAPADDDHEGKDEATCSVKPPDSSVGAHYPELARHSRTWRG